jgi:uncharacterized protein
MTRRDSCQITITAALLSLAAGVSAAQHPPPPDPPPGAAYSQEIVELRSPGAVLRGRLLLPRGSGPHPAAVFITGAGDGGEMPPLLEHLAENGFAVLSLYKRGVHGSTGNWRSQSFRGRARDVIAGMEYLRTRSEVDTSRIGLVGHSQGAWIAQIVAAERDDVAYVVMLAAVAQTVRDQILTDERRHREGRGMPAARVEREMRSLRRSLSLADAIQPACRAARAHYICHIIDFDPAPYLERLRAPVLALYAELDPEVPPSENIPLLEAGLGRAPTRDVTIRTFPGANHLFWPARTGLRDEYHSLKREFVPGFLDQVTTWMRSRAGVGEVAAPTSPCIACPDEGGSSAASHAMRHTILPFPVLFYGTETRLGGGASLVHEVSYGTAGGDRRPTASELSFIYTQNQQLIVAASVDHYSSANAYRLTGWATYMDFPEMFHGIGSGLSGMQGETFTSVNASAALSVRRRVGRSVYLGGGFGYSDFSVRDAAPGGQLAGGSISGSSGGTLSSASMSLTVDSRRGHYAPSGGTYAEARVSAAVRELGSDFTMHSYALDIRRYHQVGGTWMLAAQGYGVMARGDVPFQALPRMGGAQMMRGYHPALYRDRTMLAAQVELRAPLLWRLGGVAFAGAGEVGRELPDIVRHQPNFSYGLGARVAIRKQDSFNLRADYGIGATGRQLYFGIGEAF